MKNFNGRTLSKRVLAVLMLFAMTFTTLFGMNVVKAAGNNYDTTPPVIVNTVTNKCSGGVFLPQTKNFNWEILLKLV